MSSKVQIANIALVSYLGMTRINSLDEPNSSAIQINTIYDVARQEILSEWKWGFATRRQRLAILSNNDRPEWAFKYALPGNMIVLNWINDPYSAKLAVTDRQVMDTPREVEGGFVYSDVSGRRVCLPAAKSDPFYHLCGDPDHPSATGPYPSVYYQQNASS